MHRPVDDLRTKLLASLGQAKFSFVNTRLILLTGIDLDAASAETYDDDKHERVMSALVDMGVMGPNGEVKRS